MLTRSWKKHLLLRTIKLCSCEADLSSLSVYHVRKHLAGSKHLKIQAASGLWTLDTFSPMSTMRTPVEQRPCAELEMEVGRGGNRETVDSESPVGPSVLEGHALNATEIFSSYRCTGYKPNVRTHLHYPFQLHALMKLHFSLRGKLIF